MLTFGSLIPAILGILVEEVQALVAEGVDAALQVDCHAGLVHYGQGTLTGDQIIQVLKRPDKKQD